jgi:pathogenesis-related protein 1
MPMTRFAQLFACAVALAAPTAVRAAFLDCLFNAGFEDPGTSDAQPAAALALHNCARKTVTPAAAAPIPDLSWSSAVATLAQTYSDACHYGHSGLPGYGENIYAAAGFTPTIKTAVSAWLGEQPYYNYANNSCSAPNPPGTCGHYTQAVWDATAQVGCGISYCTQNSPFGSSFPNWWFVVCDYTPAGNDGGRPY